MAALSLNQVFQVLGLQSCAFVTLNKGHPFILGDVHVAVQVPDTGMAKVWQTYAQT